MALQNIGSLIIPSVYLLNGSTTTLTINAGEAVSTANSGWGFSFKVPKSGTLTRIGIYIQTVTTPGTLNFSLQTLSSGLPTGTNYGGSTPVSVAVTTAGWYEATISATATAGDKIAACIQNDITLTGAFTNGRLNSAFQIYTDNSPSYLNSAGGTWTKVGIAAPYLAAVGYSSTDYANTIGHITAPFLSATGEVFSTTGATRRWGADFTPQFKMRARGIIFRSPSTVQNFTGVIYDATGTTALATGTHTSADFYPSITSINTGGVYVPFDSGATLIMNAGTSYKVVAVAGTATSMNAYKATANSAGLMSMMPLSTNWTYTSYDGTSWTSDATSYPASIYLEVDQLDDGASSATGILVNSGMTGGMK